MVCTLTILVHYLFYYFPPLLYLYRVHSGNHTRSRVLPASGSELKGEGIRWQRLHTTLRVTVALGSAGHIHDLPNGLDDLPTMLI